MNNRVICDGDDERYTQNKLKEDVRENRIKMQPGKSMIIFDTETTGLNPGNIVQLSYLIINDRDIKSKNFFFKVDYVEPGAQDVHGFSVEDLKRLSKNRDFGFHAKEIHNDFENADLLVAHNIQFDMNFLKKEFHTHKLKFDKNNQFCTMNHYTNICKLPRGWGGGYKWPKLSEVVDFLKIDKKEKRKLSEHLFGVQNQPHDARSDILDTYLILKKGIELRYIHKAELGIESIRTLDKKREPGNLFRDESKRIRGHEMAM
jgi:DNA polymerase-3 subunit epsilon